MGKKGYAAVAGLLAAGLFATFAFPALGNKAKVPAQGAAKEVTLYMSALEYKGGTTVDKEAWPPAEEPGTEALDPLGGGYGLKEPDATGRWEVNSYRFEPGFFSVVRDTKVTLEIVGINGSHHDISLTNASGNEVRTAVVTRGRMTHVTFRPKALGTWTLTCHTHPPGMTASILVTE